MSTAFSSHVNLHYQTSTPARVPASIRRSPRIDDEFAVWHGYTCDGRSFKVPGALHAIDQSTRFWNATSGMLFFPAVSLVISPTPTDQVRKACGRPAIPRCSATRPAQIDATIQRHQPLVLCETEASVARPGRVDRTLRRAMASRVSVVLVLWRRMHTMIDFPVEKAPNTLEVSTEKSLSDFTLAWNGPCWCPNWEEAQRSKVPERPPNALPRK